MKKYQSTLLNACTIAIMAIGSFSCEPNDLSVQPEKNKSARISAETAESAIPQPSYSYVVYVNGILRRRNDWVYVRTGDRLFFELRAINSNYPDKPFPAVDATAWIQNLYGPNYLRFVKCWTPEFNNAYEYEITAPMIYIQGDARNIGSITVYHQSFPGSNAAEREPITINLLQVSGGISPDLPIFQ